MKSSAVRFTLITTLFLMGFHSAFAADRKLPSGALSVSQVVQALEKQGFKRIIKVEYEEDSYEVKGVNAEGQFVKYHLNPQNGVALAPEGEEAKSEKISMGEAIKTAEDSGYHDIYKIELKHHAYEIKAYDEKDRKAELEIDANSGKVKKSWF